MDHRRFDQLARDLAGARSRRSLLKGLGVALAGALAAGVQPAAADNTCKPSGHLPQSKCNKGAQCCSGVCYNGNCCTPLTVASCTLDLCGQTISDTCGGTITCPACPTTTTTTSTTTSTTTTPAPCVPATCQAGQCGTPPDGCGGILNCGDDCAATYGPCFFCDTTANACGVQPTGTPCSGSEGAGACCGTFCCANGFFCDANLNCVG